MDLYYNNASNDGDINNLANWWEDSSYTIPATNYPTASDTVYIDGDVTIPFTSLQTCAICNVGTLSSSNIINLINLISPSTAIGVYGISILTDANSGQNFDFYDSSINQASLDSSVAFNNLSRNEGVITTSGSVTFNNSSENHTTIYGAVTFNDDSINFGTCVPPTSSYINFYDNSRQAGVISGDAVFYSVTANGLGEYVNSFINGFGEVTGAIRDSSMNQIYTLIYEGFPNDGISYNGGVASYIFRSSAANDGQIYTNGVVEFDNTSSNNNGAIIGALGTVTFNELTNNGNVLYDVKFANLSADANGLALATSNAGTGIVGGSIYDVIGSQILKIKWQNGLYGYSELESIFDNTPNYGTINADAYLYGGALNNGAVYYYCYYMDITSVIAKLNQSGGGGQIGTRVPFVDILGTGLQ